VTFKNLAGKFHRPFFFQASMKTNHERRLWPAKKIALLSAEIDPLDQFQNASTLAISPCLINWVAPAQNWSHCPSGYL
jgi:hypothetical protein